KRRRNDHCRVKLGSAGWTIANPFTRHAAFWRPWCEGLLCPATPLEAADHRLPRRSRSWRRQWRSRCGKRQPADLIVLVDIPESAVISGIDGHFRVIAPSGVGSGLHPCAVYDSAFAQSHLAKRVASESAGVPNTRIHVRAIHYAITKGHVPVLVLSDATHPAMDTIVWCIRSLLINGVVSARPPDLVPTRAGDAWQCLYGLVSH